MQVVTGLGQKFGRQAFPLIVWNGKYNVNDDIFG